MERILRTDEQYIPECHFLSGSYCSDILSEIFQIILIKIHGVQEKKEERKKISVHNYYNFYS